MRERGIAQQRGIEIISTQVIVRRLAISGCLTLALLCPLFAQSPAAAELGRAVLTAGFDKSACYRVHDIEISEEDAHFYHTDGYLMFGNPVNGAPVAAVFSAEVAAGDGEVLLLPPDRSERKALSSYTNSPTLDEHFTNAIFFFTEAQARGLAAEIRAKGEAKASPEVGAILSDQWSAALRNLAGSFESRLVLDLLAGGSAQTGFFEAIMQGKKLGNFDVGYDARGAEQLNAGQITTRNGNNYWDTWTSFTAKSRRNLPRPAPEEEILSYRIEATLDASFTLHCITRIRIRTTANSRVVIPFDLSGQIRATEATIDGVPAEVYSRESVRNGFVQSSGNELLLIVPPQPLEPGSEHEIEIHHEGNVVQDFGHQVYFVTARGSWYPNRGTQFATYDVTWHYPKTLDLVSAGQVKEDRTEGDIRITQRVPDGRMDMLAFNLGQYERKIVDRNGIQIAVNANREVENALRIRAPDPVPLSSQPENPLRRRGPRGFSDPTMIKPPETPAVLAEINPANQLTHIADEIAASIGFYRAPLSATRRLHGSRFRRFRPASGRGLRAWLYLSTLSYLPPNVRPLSLLPAWEQVFYSDLLRRS